MAYQPFNYAGIEPQGYPAIKNLVENLVKGYKASQVPRETAQQQQEQELKNKILGFEAQDYPEKSQLNRDYIAAQTANQRGLASEKELMNQYLKQYLPGNQQQQQGGLSNINPNVKPSDVANAIFRKHFGIPEETVSEKSEREFEDFKRKKQYESEQEKMGGTTATTTSIQGQLLGIQNTIPHINEILTSDLPYRFTPGGTPSNRMLDTLVTKAAENYAVSQGWGKGIESIEKAKRLFERSALESDKDYKNRIKVIKRGLEEQRDNLSSAYNPSAKKQESSYSDEDIMFTAQKYNMTPEQVRIKLQERSRK